MTVANPQVQLSIIPADPTPSNAAQKVLFVGQQIGGTATAGTLTSNIGTRGEENGLFGAKSRIAAQIRAFRLINPLSQVDAISLADAGGAVVATGTFTITASPTASGNISFSVGSERNNKYVIPFTSTSTATTIATALVAAITADIYAVVSAANTAGVVTVTALNLGTVGNGITLKVKSDGFGVSCAIVGMASGATDPTLTGIFSVVGNTRYQTIVYPKEYPIAVLTTNFLDLRWNPNLVSNAVLDGVGVITNTDTYANLITYGNAQNSQNATCIGIPFYSTAASLVGGACCELTDVISAEFAATRSLRLTPGASLSLYVTTNASADQIGGPGRAGLPYFNTPFYNLPLIDPSLSFTGTEQAALLVAGISVIDTNVAGNLMIAGQIATLYKTNSAGVADGSYKYLNYVDETSNVREYMFNNLRADYSQTRVTQGDVEPDFAVVNEGAISGQLDAYYVILSQNPYVITQSGQDAISYFQANKVVTIDVATGICTVFMKAPIVGQLRSIIGTIKISFSTIN